jgi:hypothetical protein
MVAWGIQEVRYTRLRLKMDILTNDHVQLDKDNSDLLKASAANTLAFRSSTTMVQAQGDVIASFESVLSEWDEMIALLEKQHEKNLPVPPRNALIASATQMRNRTEAPMKKCTDLAHSFIKEIEELHPEFARRFYSGS